MSDSEATASTELDVLGRRRSPATRPEFRRGVAPGNKGLKLPAEVLSESEIAVLEAARSPRGQALEARDRAIITLLYRARLKVSELLSLGTDFDQSAGTLGRPTGGRLELDSTSRELLAGWIQERKRLRIPPSRKLFCGVQGAARGRAMQPSAVRVMLRERAERADLHRRVTPEGLRKSGREHAERRMAAIALSSPARAEFERLLSHIDDAVVRGYVEEAMNCLAVDAFRASVVLLWTGAVRTLQERALAYGAGAVTEALQRHHPKVPAVHRLSDFENVRDAQLLMGCRELGMLDKGQWRTLEHALGLRNTCGHPSEAGPGRVRVEAFIEDVVGIVWP